MATKNVVEVVIAGKVLKITGYESVEYLHQVASYINEKIGEFELMDGYRRQPSDQKQIMVYMNLADDYFKSKHLAEQQKADLEKKEKEMYSLKHDLIECQMARESMEKTSKEEEARWQEELEQKDSQIKAQSVQLEEQQTKLQEQESELQEQQTKLQERESELQEQQTRVLELESKIQDLQGQLKFWQEQMRASARDGRQFTDRPETDNRSRYSNRNTSSRGNSGSGSYRGNQGEDPN